MTEFCSFNHLTPTITEFYDDKDRNGLCVSDQDSDIKEESKLKIFTQALQKAQITASQEERKEKQEKMIHRTVKENSKMSHTVQSHIEIALKGFLPVDKFMRLKGTNKKEKDNNDEPAPELDNIYVY